MSDDDSLVDPDSDITVDNYTHYSDGDFWGGDVTEGYGKDRDRYENPYADGDANGDKPTIYGSGWAHGIPLADDGSAALSGTREAAHELWNFIQTGDLSDISGVLDTMAAAVGLAGDVLSLADDPAGTLVAWATSWCLEHVTVLRMALDGLAGNPDVIKAYATTWSNIAGRLDDIGKQFASTAIGGPGNWTGEAGNAYRTMAADVSTAIDASATMARVLSYLLTAVGQLVNGVRDLVKALISELVGLIVDTGEAAILDEGQAAGGVGRAVMDIGAKVLKLLAKLAKVLDDLGPVITAVNAIRSSITSAWHQYQGDRQS